MRRLATIAVGIAGILGILAAGAYLGRLELLRLGLGLPAFTHSSGASQWLRVPMRDGVALATMVQRPAGDARSWPAVLIRNPYDAGTMIESWCDLFVRYGYACVYQQARGQMDSEGEWEPIVNEANDGEDTLAWLVGQDFQDGNIALYGPSYLAAVQWAAATRGLPPEVKTLVPMMFGTDMHEVAYQGGMFRHEILTAWAALMPGRGFATENGEHYLSAVRHRPHREIDQRYFGAKLGWYQDWIASPSESAPLWQREDIRAMTNAPSTVAVPVLAIAGWYDIFFAAQLEDWRRLATRARSKLVIGPWTHGMQPGGDLDLVDARGPGYQWQLVLDWLAHHLRGEPLAGDTGVVERYVLGEGRWESASQWPPATRDRVWHLDALGQAHGCDGGLLSDAPPRRAEQISFLYDPDDPVPMRGGAGSLAFLLPGFGGSPAASVRQERICERADVLSFATVPLAQPLHLAGPVRAVLGVRSDAPDTAFTAKLVEVRADGDAYNVRDGIVSLAYRDRTSEPLSYEPGSFVEIAIETWPIEWVFAAGSKLRLDVSSSNFPAYHAHTNRAGPWAEQESAALAQQTLASGRLVLPIATP